MSNPTRCDDHRRNHDLYRMRDLSGRLLYIGVTNGGLRRFMEHAKDKTWWLEVASIDIEHVHCSRQAIEMLEREAIKSESPLYNVTHNQGQPLPPPVAPVVPAPVAPVSEPTVEELQPGWCSVGDRVTHLHFGDGWVCDLWNHGTDDEGVTIQFDGIGEKHLATKWAALRIVGAL